MNLLNLPEEVIEGHLLPLLKWNDLLRFRRVCKSTRDITTSYMRVHPELAPELEVNLEEKSFKAFLKMGIPTTKLFLKNEESGFFDQNWDTIQLFLKKYGHLVNYLRMSKLSTNLEDNELEFLLALTNLKGLEASTFGQQVVIQLGSMIKYSIGCLVTLQKFLQESKEDEFNNSLALAFLTFFKVIQKGLERDPNVNFNSIDFVGYHDNPKEKQKLMESRGAFSFLWLALSCLENGVKLKNVGTNWFDERESPMALPGADAKELGNVVVSMVNVQPGVFPLEMNNLERIDIRATSQCDTRLRRGQSRPDWPNLKVLEICVDSNVVVLPGEMEVLVDLQNRRVDFNSSRRKTKHLLDFFFKRVTRVELVELELKFQEDKKKEDLAVPEMQDIVNSCPNLKKLRIVNWPGTNEELVKLWNGLEGLEEVSLENCKQVENGGFVGEDWDNPAFLKLKNLKKVSLKGLDLMPGITDTLFSLVIRHLKLTHLVLTSNDAIKSVTLAGIESLLSGQFAKSIEKFPFGQWSLVGVSVEQLDELKQMFRSSKIL